MGRGVRMNTPLKPALVLMLSASPSDATPLSLDREARTIQDQINQAEDEGRASRISLATRWAAHPLDLLRELRKLRPIVVHFSGYGGREGLYFQRCFGASQAVSPRAIAEAFAASGAPVRLVVLSTCYTDKYAEALLEHVDCIIGMSRSYSDYAGRAFVAELYRALGRGATIANAYHLACAKGCTEIGTPPPRILGWGGFSLRGID